MALPEFAELEVGDTIPELALPPLSRHTLAIYCGASGDHNPIHVDLDFAREAGLDDVIAHGMLIMAYGARCLTAWVPQTAIKRYDTRFEAMTHIGNAVTVSGQITAKEQTASGNFVTLRLEAKDQHGEVKTRGEAVVELK